MRHLHSEFHFRHALFALQSPDGYVDALLESAGRRLVPSHPATPSSGEPCDPQMALFAPTPSPVAKVRYRHH